MFESNKKDYLKEIKDATSWQRQVENKLESLQSTLEAIVDALDRNGIPVIYPAAQADDQDQDHVGDVVDEAQAHHGHAQEAHAALDQHDNANAFLVDHH